MKVWLIINYSFGFIITMVSLLVSANDKERLSKKQFYYWCTYPIWGSISSFWFLATIVYFALVYLKKQYKRLFEEQNDQ